MTHAILVAIQAVGVSVHLETHDGHRDDPGHDVSHTVTIYGSYT